MGMWYTEVLRKLYEVMEGRTDIVKVEFDREDDKFTITFDSGSKHICFGSEFRDTDIGVR